jgi:hypothetical protein
MRASDELSARAFFAFESKRPEVFPDIVDQQARAWRPRQRGAQRGDRGPGRPRRGRITDVQQPRYGAQALDVSLPD